MLRMNEKPKTFLWVSSVEAYQIRLGFSWQDFDEGRLPVSSSLQSFQIHLKATQFYKIDHVGEDSSSSWFQG